MEQAALHEERGRQWAHREEDEKRQRVASLEAQINAKQRLIWERARRDAELSAAAEEEAVDLAVSYMTRDFDGQLAAVVSNGPSRSRSLPAGAMASELSSAYGDAPSISSSSAAAGARGRGLSASDLDGDGGLDDDDSIARWSQRHSGLDRRRQGERADAAAAAKRLSSRLGLNHRASHGTSSSNSRVGMPAAAVGGDSWRRKAQAELKAELRSGGGI